MDYSYSSSQPFHHYYYSTSHNNNNNTLFQEPDRVEDSCPSDCESAISDHTPHRPRKSSHDTITTTTTTTTTGLLQIDNHETVYTTISNKLLSNFTSFALHSLHRKDYSSGFISPAKLQSFALYLKAMDLKHNGNPNVNYLWFAAASKREATDILTHGFKHQAHFASPDHPLHCLPEAQEDEDGLRYMLLCRVILGKTEEVVAGSGQDNPSSHEFDSALLLDDQHNLNKKKYYLVWSSRVNTHVLPEFLISFRASINIPSPRGHRPRPHQQQHPSSHWMPFATLISALTKFLPPDAVALIAKYHSDYKNKKLARYEMIQKVRVIAGDKLLMSIIKSYQRR